MPGHPAIWIIVGHGSTVLAVVAGGVAQTFSLSSLFSYSLSLGDGPI